MDRLLWLAALLGRHHGAGNPGGGGPGDGGGGPTEPPPDPDPGTYGLTLVLQNLNLGGVQLFLNPILAPSDLTLGGTPLTLGATTLFLGEVTQPPPPPVETFYLIDSSGNVLTDTNGNRLTYYP